MSALPVMEILGLAYMRLGEVNNCLNNHNEYSCILPLIEEGQHKEKWVLKKQLKFSQKSTRDIQLKNINGY